MIARRHVSTVLMAASVGLLLTQFQNCAPTSLAPQTNSNVKIIDEFNKAEIAFVEPETQLHDEVASAGLDGFCSRTYSGKKISWAVYASQLGGKPVLAGSSQCQSGGFRVELLQLENISCGENHLLVVEGDWGGSAVGGFSKRCQPLASEPIAPPDMSPLGTECSIEYRASAGSPDACMQVCYRDAKVIFSQSVEVVKCQPLVDKLVAGK